MNFIIRQERCQGRLLMSDHIPRFIQLRVTIFYIILQDKYVLSSLTV